MSLTDKQQRWKEWLPKLEAAVHEGAFDHILFDVAKLVYARRDVLQGLEPGATFLGKRPFDIGPIIGIEVEGGSRDLGRLAQQIEIAPVQQGHASWSINDIVRKVYPVNPFGYPGDRRRYVVPWIPNVEFDKHDLMGRIVFTSDYSITRPKYIANIAVEIKGLGVKKVKCVLAEKPYHGRSWAQKYDDQTPIFLPYEYFKHLFSPVPQ